MTIEMVGDEGQRIEFPPPPRSSRSRAAPADKPLDAPTTKSEVERALCTIYNLVHKILHDEVRYGPEDFGEEADGLIDLFNQHAAARVVLRVLRPIASIAALVEKAQGTIERYRARMAELRDRSAPRATVPVEAPAEGGSADGAEPTTNPAPVPPPLDRGWFQRPG